MVPDFVIELRSYSERLKQLQAKMQSYVENGVRLGWLIDPATSRVHIYQPGKAIEILVAPETDSNAQILPEFLLDLKPIWKQETLPS